MDKQTTATFRGTTIGALARDGDGNAIQLPDGAAGWRIRRQTGGRPRLHLDSKKQPMVFSLSYTVADAEEILPPGSYRFDLVDSNGDSLDVTVPLPVGVSRSADSTERDGELAASAADATTLPMTSDVRMVLDANVRAMQMAFLHNQKMLEIGLRMAETLRDSVQVLATSQADWIKSVASARAWEPFRGAPPRLTPEVNQITKGGNERVGGDENNAEPAEGLANG
jgi:hypothetical protein